MSDNSGVPPGAGQFGSSMPGKDKSLVVTDVLGMPINVGDYVVYPGRRSSSLWITVARVLEIAVRPTWHGNVPFVRVQPLNPKTRRPVGKPSPLTRLDLLTKVYPHSAEV